MDVEKKTVRRCWLGILSSGHVREHVQQGLRIAIVYKCMRHHRNPLLSNVASQQQAPGTHRRHFRNADALDQTLMQLSAFVMYVHKAVK